MELDILRNFITTAEALNFRKAAEIEFISQPALSRRIAGLEREIGVELFARGSRGVQLTRAGHVMLREARQLLDNADHAVAAVRGLSYSDCKDVTVGLVGNAGACLTASLLCELRDRVSDASIRIRAGDWDTLLGELGFGGVDIVFGYLPQEVGRGRTALPLWELEVAMLVHNSHPAAGRDSAPIELFAKDRIMVPYLGRDYRRQLAAAGFNVAAELPTGCRSDTIASIEVAAAARCGVGLVPRRAMSELPPGTAMVSPVPAAPPCVFGLVHGEARSSVVDTLLELATARATVDLNVFRNDRTRRQQKIEQVRTDSAGDLLPVNW
jgi:DNA-binding transcriptional LysR family regulator